MKPSAPVVSGTRVLLAAFTAAFLLAGCSGDDGSDGADGQPGPPGPGTTSEAASLTFALDDITIASPPVVNFTLTNEDGVRFTGLASGQIRFTLAKLVPGANGAPSAWQNYINRTETKGAGDWGAGGTAIQGNSESDGTLLNNLDGTYTYTFSTNVTNVTTPLAVAYDATLTHRLGVQISGGDLPVTNATYDWRPSDGATSGITARDIVQTASCNECHGKLALHGGGRIDTKLCVTCHNPGTTDANSGNTVDFKVMIHKIHRGEFLPSVEAGGEYAIWGFRDAKHDYSEVALPQDIRNCTKCHDAADTATPQAGNWQDVPSVEACGACHDDVDFATGAGHSTEQFVAQNGECTVCHSDGGFVGSVASSHVIPAKVEGAKYAFAIVSVANTAPGEFPVVTYKVTDPSNGNTPYVLTSGGAWTNTGNGASRLAIDLGWSTTDYHNLGNGSSTTPASAISLNGLGASTGNNAAPVANGDGTYTVTSLRAVPAAGVSGSGVAALEGHPAADYDGDGTFTDRVPVKAAITFFAITDAAPVARRTVVDIAKCNKCHDQLSLHGSNRTDEPQLCVICHNPDNTDIARRGGTTGVDGLAEQAIDFKVLVHAIHGADKRENPFVVYGFGGSVHDFSRVEFPGILNNCNTCHVNDSFEVPLAASVRGTTTGSNAIADNSDDVNTTPTAAVCSSCHDTDLAQTHMEQNGASFVMVGDPGSYNEACAVCHGPGRLADIAEVHEVTP